MIDKIDFGLLVAGFGWIFSLIISFIIWGFSPEKSTDKSQDG